jgi:hypothetical protein
MVGESAGIKIFVDIFAPGQSEEKRFFFEKKKQKTFARLGQWSFQKRGLRDQKFFLPRPRPSSFF